MNRQFVALVGSPRPRSTSGQFAKYLADGFAARGWRTAGFTATGVVRQADRMDDLKAAFEAAEVVAIVTPLYADSLPSELTLALEGLAPLRPAPGGRLFALVNSGFIEAHQNDVALDICRLFARDAGLRWAGGLAVGGGGFYDGRPLAGAHGPARRLVRQLDATIAALDAGSNIPESVAAAVRRPVISPTLYFLVANLMMLLGAAKNGSLFKLAARPYRAPRGT